MKPGFKRVFAKAVSGPLNMSTLGVAAVGAAALGSWPILAIGGATYAALVAWDLVNPNFWKKALEQRGADNPDLPEPKKILDPEARAQVAAFASARDEIKQAVADTQADIQQHLVDTVVSIDELEGRAARLVDRCEDLNRYLASARVEGLRAEIARLTEQIGRTRDPETKAQYQETLKARHDQLKTVDDIATARERVLANLARIVATIEGVPAKIVRMRALDAEAADAMSGDVNAELDRMNGEIRTFEETMETLVEVPRS